MKVLYKLPGEYPQVKEIENDLEALQALVGGYIETLDVVSMLGTDRRLVMICDEETKLKEPRPETNLMITPANYVLGPVVLVAAEEDYFDSLTIHETEMGRGWLNMVAVKKRR
jgi:hypothetical protein